MDGSVHVIACDYWCVCVCVCVRARAHACLIACIKESMYTQNGKYVENRHFCHHFNFLFYSGFSWICK